MGVADSVPPVVRNWDNGVELRALKFGAMTFFEEFRESGGKGFSSALLHAKDGTAQRTVIDAE
jgi:hypothetical protein